MSYRRQQPLGLGIQHMRPGPGPGTHLQVPLLPDIEVDVIKRIHLRHRIQGRCVQGNDGELLDRYGEGSPTQPRGWG